MQNVFELDSFIKNIKNIKSLCHNCIFERHISQFLYKQYIFLLFKYMVEDWILKHEKLYLLLKLLCL